jgi:DnaJ domain
VPRSSLSDVAMARSSRNLDWGFPRWRGYGSEGAAATVRLCDRHGCDVPGDRPAPKAPNSPERWYFCERHAAEYNQNWDYFEGLSAEDAAERARNEGRDASAFSSAAHYAWGGPGDGTRSRDEMRALSILELASDASHDDARAAWRRLAKANHPDIKPGDEAAAARFREIQAAWDVLRSAEDRRNAA